MFLSFSFTPYIRIPLILYYLVLNLFKFLINGITLYTFIATCIFIVCKIHPCRYINLLFLRLHFIGELYYSLSIFLLIVTWNVSIFLQLQTTENISIILKFLKLVVYLLAFFKKFENFNHSLINRRHIYEYQLYMQYIIIIPSEIIEMYIIIFTRISKFNLLFIVLSHSPAIGKNLLAATMFILTFPIFNIFPADLEPSQ